MRAALAWAALIVPLWVVLVLCTHWEPVMRDSWGHTLWHFWHHTSPGSIAGFFVDSWRTANPRLGQTLTLVVFTPGPWHELITPLVELGLFALLTTLVLGRWPSLRRADDALVFATVTAITALCAPQFGPMLFYRPFTGNYLFGLALNVAWLVPFRLHVEAPRAHGWWFALGLVLLGVAAGLCNEHTGPAFLAAGVLAIVWVVRRGERIAPWMIAGVVGLAIGYALLMLAPGQDARYGGLATHSGLLERVLDRGAVENVHVISKLGFYLRWALPWIALAVIARIVTRRGAPVGAAPPSVAPTPSLSIATRASLWTLAGAGVLCTVALLASPKLGSRLYFASAALIASALTGAIVAQLTTRWARAACATLSALTLLYVGVRCVLVTHAAGEVSAERLRIIRKGPYGIRVVVPRYHLPASDWFLGEDLDSDELRTGVAGDYGLAGIDLAP